MELNELFEGIDDFDTQDKLSTVDTTSFSNKDKLSLEVKEDEVRKHINLLETQRGDRDDEDVDLDIKKAKLSLMEHEDELIGKYKPVPTDKPTEDKTFDTASVAEEVGGAITSFNEFTDKLRDEAYAPFKPAVDVMTNYVGKVQNALGGTIESAWNFLTGEELDTFEKARILNERQAKKLDRTIDPKDEAFFSPTEVASLTASMLPVVKATSSAEVFAALEGIHGYVEGFAKTGEIGEAVEEAGISTGLALVGGKLAEKFFPDKKVPTEFGKKIERLAPDDKAALTKVLDNLDKKSIDSLSEDSRDKLIDDIMSKSMDTEEVTANVTAMLRRQKEEAQKAVSSAYDEANKIARETEAVPTTRAWFDAVSTSKRTKPEKDAIKQIKVLLKDKNLNAEDMETVLRDLKSLQRSSTAGGKNVYGKAIESLQKMQNELGGEDIYGAAREMSKKFKKDYTGTIVGEGSTAGAKVGDVLEKEYSHNIGKKLVGTKIDANQVGTAVEGLSSGNKLQVVQDILKDGVDDVKSVDGIKRTIQNFKKINPDGLDKILGKDVASRLRLDMDTLETMQEAILASSKVDTGIKGEILDIVTAVSMVKLSPFLAARSTGHGIKKIVSKKAMAKERGQLIARVKTIKDAELKRTLMKGMTVLFTPKASDDYKALDTEDVVTFLDEQDESMGVKEEVVEEPTEKKSIFTDKDFEEFDYEVEQEKPKQEVKWGRGVVGKDGKGVYSRTRPSSSVTNNNYGTSGKVSEARVYDKLSEREGVKNTVYKDTKGLPTAGIGHLLTDAEKKKYPVGTTIPKAQIDKWYEQDTRKSKNAAKMQAKEIGEPRLEEALIHVNFQLGTQWKKKFKETYPLLKQKKYTQAINNLKKSAWMEQTPKRVNDFIAEIRKVM